LGTLQCWYKYESDCFHERKSLVDYKSNVEGERGTKIHRGIDHSKSYFRRKIVTVFLLNAKDTTFFPILVCILWEFRQQENNMKNSDFLDKIYSKHEGCCKYPSEQKIKAFLNDLLGTLFPELTDEVFHNRSRFGLHFANLRETFYELIYARPNNEAERAENNTEIFCDALPEIYEKLLEDAKAMYDGDPAAESKEEVIRTYPGFYAIASYRIAHQLHQQNIKLIPRAIAEIAHNKTGIDIHPAAEIGDSFFIDHGTGVVIGATSKIGNNVKIYQGVTLGALSVAKEDSKVKRHPTLEDNVIVYAGATILGGQSIIGKGSVIGGNVWITRSVPPNSTVYYKTKMNSDEDDQTDILMHKIAH